MVGVFAAILSEIKERYVSNKNTVSENDVLLVIKDYNTIPAIKNMPKEVIRPLFDSEARKAQLMLDSENGIEWSQCIRNAEEYYEDGNIDFILNIISDNCKPSEFIKIFNNSKAWLDNKKDPKDCVAFNEALLCLDYGPDYEKMAHLRVYSKNEVWQLFFGKQGNLREDLLNKEIGNAGGLQYGIGKLFKIYDTTISIKNFADKVITAYTIL